MGKEWDSLTRNLMNPTSEKDKKRKEEYNGSYAGRRSNLPDYTNTDKMAMQQWHYEWAKEALRVAKPGAILMAFGGTRTSHRLACAIEDAGWVLRDTIMWVYGSGFPKSHDISKAIDKRAGVEREKGRVRTDGRGKWELKVNREKGDTGVGHADGSKQTYQETVATSPEAQTWAGYGTALKPAYEPIILAMKPLDGTFAENALKWGVGGLWIDGGRVEHSEECKMMAKQTDKQSMTGDGKVGQGGRHTDVLELKPQGRWPANLIHDGSEEVVGLFPDSKGMSGGGKHKATYSKDGVIAGGGHDGNESHIKNDSGSAARFFKCCPQDELSRLKYSPKASKAERNKGCEHLYWKRNPQTLITKEEWELLPEKDRSVGNIHPTVKSLALMKYLCTLVQTPTKGVGLDLFGGSGTTAVACEQLGIPYIIIEKEPDYCEIIKCRIKAANDPEPIKKTKKVAKPKTNQQPGLFPQDKINEWCEIK